MAGRSSNFAPAFSLRPYSKTTKPSTGGTTTALTLFHPSANVPHASFVFSIASATSAPTSMSAVIVRRIFSGLPSTPLCSFENATTGNEPRDLGPRHIVRSFVVSSFGWPPFRFPIAESCLHVFEFKNSCQPCQRFPKINLTTQTTLITITTWTRKKL